jgi:hypothetical protein
MYYLGRDVEQDYQAAFMWYLKAAKQGSGEAQNSLGAMYFEGLGVERNLIEAYAWFKLAEQGEQEISKLNIGIIETKLSPEELDVAREKADAYSVKYRKSGDRD